MPTQRLGVVPAGLNSQLEPLPFSRRMRFPRDPAGMSIPGFSAPRGGPAVQPPRCGEGAALAPRVLHAGYTRVTQPLLLREAQQSLRSQLSLQAINSSFSRSGSFSRNSSKSSFASGLPSGFGAGCPRGGDREGVAAASRPPRWPRHLPGCTRSSFPPCPAPKSPARLSPRLPLRFPG